MHVVILTLVFPPDNVSTARLVGDLAADLQSSGSRVTVLTTKPHYNRDVEAEARQPLRRRWPLLLHESTYHGVRVLHTFMPRKGKRILPRLLGWAGFHALSTLAGLFDIDRPDVVLAVSPPLTIGLGAWLLAAPRRVPYVYNVQELYPDLAVTLGLIRSRALVWTLLRLEAFVYAHASAITAIGTAMADRLREKRVPASKIRIIPNFVDVQATRPGERNNDFRRANGLGDRVVVSYAGNFGLAQGLEVVVDAAARLRDDPRVTFLLVGDGVLRESLVARARAAGAENCVFLPYQPHSVMAGLYAASDVCLVPQATATGCQAVPSKAYQVMAAGRAILALTETGSDLERLVLTERCGRVVPPDSVDALSEAILDAAGNPDAWREMGTSGRAAAERSYSRQSISGAYRAFLEELSQGSQARG